MTDFFKLGIQKYWAPTANVSKEVRKIKLEQAINSGEYLWSEKYDGNFLRAIITPNKNALQTRGISTKTGTYGEVQDKVLFWNNIVSACNKGTTVLLGEGYIPGGIDATVGSILRSLPPKALARQKDIKLEYRIFDVLALDGEEFLDKPIEERIKYIPIIVQRINSPLVKEVKFYEMDSTFFDKIEEIFARHGEGAVCYKKGVLYTPDKRSSAWTTIKVKQEISNDIDCFIIDVEPAIKSYTGKELSSWTFWEDTRTGEKLYGEYFGEYQTGKAVIPISKGYYYNWPGAIYVGVYDNNGNIYNLCKVAGLTEELKTALRDNFNEWYLCPLTIGGMMLSESNGLSVRHPYIKSIRKNDIDPKDCTLKKILA